MLRSAFGALSKWKGSPCKEELSILFHWAIHFIPLSGQSWCRDQLRVEKKIYIGWLDHMY